MVASKENGDERREHMKQKKGKMEAVGVGFHVLCPRNTRASGLGLFCRTGCFESSSKLPWSYALKISFSSLAVL